MPRPVPTKALRRRGGAHAWAESLERSVHQWMLTKSAFAGCHNLILCSGQSAIQILTHIMQKERHISEHQTRQSTTLAAVGYVSKCLRSERIFMLFGYQSQGLGVAFGYEVQ